MARLSDTAGASRAGVLDSTGEQFFPDSCATTGITRDVNGNVLTRTISDGSHSWVQTITRDANGSVVTVSRWVRQ